VPTPVARQRVAADDHAWASTGVAECDDLAA